jgi:hypothetical protein
VESIARNNNETLETVESYSKVAVTPVFVVFIERLYLTPLLNVREEIEYNTIGTEVKDAVYFTMKLAEVPDKDAE